MATATKKVEAIKEPVLEANRLGDDQPVDLTFVGGHREMSVKGIHHHWHAGPTKKDEGFIIVMEDEVGNKRVGRVSKTQLRAAFRELEYEFYD